MSRAASVGVGCVGGSLCPSVPRSRRSVFDRFEHLAYRFLELDRQLLGNRRAFLGDQRRQAARGLRDRAAQLLAPVAIGLRKRELTELTRQQWRFATLVERDSPDRLQRLL